MSHEQERRFSKKRGNPLNELPRLYSATNKTIHEEKAEYMVYTPFPTFILLAHDDTTIYRCNIIVARYANGRLMAGVLVGAYRIIHTT